MENRKSIESIPSCILWGEQSGNFSIPLPLSLYPLLRVPSLLPLSLSLSPFLPLSLSLYIYVYICLSLGRSLQGASQFRDTKRPGSIESQLKLLGVPLSSSSSPIPRGLGTVEGVPKAFSLDCDRIATGMRERERKRGREREGRGKKRAKRCSRRGKGRMIKRGNKVPTCAATALGTTFCTLQPFKG